MKYYWDLILICVLLSAIAFGTIWTAYESHVANIGVMAWQHQFDEIRLEGATPLAPDDSGPPVAVKPHEPPIQSF